MRSNSMAMLLSALLVLFLMAATGSIESSNPVVTGITTPCSIYGQWDTVEIVLTVDPSSLPANNTTMPDDVPVWVLGPSGAGEQINATFNGTCYVAVFDPGGVDGYYTAFAFALGSDLSVTFFIDPPAPWPADSAWLSYVNYSWYPCRNPFHTLSPSRPYLVMASGGNAATPRGPLDTLFYDYDDQNQTFFFRMRLQGNPFSGGTYIATSAWQVYMDTNGDGGPDWLCELKTVGGTAVATFYNRSGDNLACSGVHTPTQLVADYGRHLTDGTSIGGVQLYFIDWQAPLSMFQDASPANRAGNITNKTVMRLFYGTSRVATSINSDWAFTGASPMNFSQASNITAQAMGRNEYGLLADTRDDSPSSDNGTWYYGQPLTVSGSGWPIANASVQNLTVRVTNSTGTVANSTVIGYDRNTGRVTNVTIWQIPVNITAFGPGLYNIWVLDPMFNAYQLYDNFTLVDNIPPIVQNVILSPSTTTPGTSVLITANVTDNYMLSSVTATLNGSACPMSLNVTSGLYQATLTAPLSEGGFVVNVTALDTSGNRGNGSAILYVVVPVNVTKSITWNATARQYNVRLSAANPSLVNSSMVFDFVPAGFIASQFIKNGIAYIPDYHGAAVISGPATIGWNLNQSAANSMTYLLTGNSQMYVSTDTYVLGIDPREAGT